MREENEFGWAGEHSRLQKEILKESMMSQCSGGLFATYGDAGHCLAEYGIEDEHDSANLQRLDIFHKI